MTTCTSCGARIFFAASSTTGRLIPFDAEPTADGTHCIEPDLTLELVAYPAPDGYSAAERYTTHFATCPNAEKHRKTAQPAQRKMDFGTD